MVYPSRNVELLKGLLDQTIVLYGAFIGGLFVVIMVVLWLWLKRVGWCYSWVHNAGLETLWTIVPVVYLGLALVHGVGVLYGMEGVRSYSAGSGKTIQVIGHQWYWEYVLGG